MAPTTQQETNNMPQLYAFGAHDNFEHFGLITNTIFMYGNSTKYEKFTNFLKVVVVLYLAHPIPIVHTKQIGRRTDIARGIKFFRSP